MEKVNTALKIIKEKSGDIIKEKTIYDVANLYSLNIGEVDMLLDKIDEEAIKIDAFRNDSVRYSYNESDLHSTNKTESFVKYLLRVNGMTSEDLASEISIPTLTVDKWIRRQHTHISKYYQDVMAQFFKVDVVYFRSQRYTYDEVKALEKKEVGFINWIKPINKKNVPQKPESNDSIKKQIPENKIDEINSKIEDNEWTKSIVKPNIIELIVSNSSLGKDFLKNEINMSDSEINIFINNISLMPKNFFDKLSDVFDVSPYKLGNRRLTNSEIDKINYQITRYVEKQEKNVRANNEISFREDKQEIRNDVLFLMLKNERLGLKFLMKELNADKIMVEKYVQNEVLLSVEKVKLLSNKFNIPCNFFNQKLEKEDIKEVNDLIEVYYRKKLYKENGSDNLFKIGDNVGDLTENMNIEMVFSSISAYREGSLINNPLFLYQLINTLTKCRLVYSSGGLKFFKRHAKKIKIDKQLDSEIKYYLVNDINALNEMYREETVGFLELICRFEKKYYDKIIVLMITGDVELSKMV
jgi:transcriptional regulator with XRE-family HTH domain